MPFRFLQIYNSFFILKTFRFVDYTFGVSDNVDEIFVAELKQTFHKKPEKEKLPFSQHDIFSGKSIVLSEELRKSVVDIVAGKHDNGSTTPKAATEPVNINIIE